MVEPNLHPVPRPAAAQAYVQSFDARLGVLFTTGVVLPATAPAVTLPIVVSAAGFLLISASACGNLSAPRFTGMVLVVDGAKVATTAVSNTGGAGAQMAFAITARVPVAAGAHTVTVEFGNTLAALVFSIDPVANPDLESCSLVVAEVSA